MKCWEDCSDQLLVRYGVGSPGRAAILAGKHLGKTNGWRLCARPPPPGPRRRPGRPCSSQALGHVPTQPCALVANRIEEVKGFQALRLALTEKYEKENCRGFRLIYPSLSSEKYEKFFQDNSSLFQNTVASRARELYAR